MGQRKKKRTDDVISLGRKMLIQQAVQNDTEEHEFQKLVSSRVVLPVRNERELRTVLV